jgi:hypothetical protein
MANRNCCTCRRCTIRGLMGPAVLITLGVLFLLNQLRGYVFGFHYTWPVLLLVIGIIKLAESLASDEGHGSGALPPSQIPGPQGQGQ